MVWLGAPASSRQKYAAGTAALHLNHLTHITGSTSMLVSS
jgi:hypothetical protein